MLSGERSRSQLPNGVNRKAWKVVYSQRVALTILNDSLVMVRLTLHNRAMTYFTDLYQFNSLKTKTLWYLFHHSFVFLFSCKFVTVLVLIDDSLLLTQSTLLVGKGVRGRPGRAVAGRLALVVHLVDLLERVRLGLVDEEVDERNADEAEREPDEEDLGLQVGVSGTVVDQVGGCVGDSPVEEPLYAC